MNARCKDATLEPSRPWLGRTPQKFAPPRSAPARRFVAQTAEERFWRRWCPQLFASGGQRGPIVRLVEHVTVTPIAHVTLLNLDYQIYLNQVLHTHAGTWLSHAVLIPISVALSFYALALYTSVGAAILLGLLAAWYVGMAIRQHSPLWGALALAVLVGLWGVGEAAAAWVGAPWWLRPLPLLAAVSILQACSHLFEANVPPRANFERGWVPVREFVWGDPAEVPLGRRLLRLAWSPIGLLWGALDEWWASAKLLPMYLLEIMWAAGYRPAQRDRARALALAALASGDPALDWVGVGGGASVAALGEPCADDDAPDCELRLAELEPRLAI